MVVGGGVTEDYNKEAFARFWEWYPLKKGKPKAREIFLKITAPGGYRTRTFDKDSGTYIDLHLTASPEQLVEAAKEFWKSLPSKGESYTRDTTYCPHPATWLNQGRFEDYMEE